MSVVCRSVAKKHMEKLQAEQCCLALEVAQLKTDVLCMQQIQEASIKKHDAEMASIRDLHTCVVSEINTSEWPRLSRTAAVGGSKVLEKPTVTSTEKTEKVFLAKIHTELNENQRRARNVIVRGLEPVDGVDDVNVFSTFCEQFLPVKPVVVRCHRIGKKETGKVQPLLAVLRSADIASELLTCAPRLRQCTDE
jgi:hypothetical protein